MATEEWIHKCVGDSDLSTVLNDFTQKGWTIYTILAIGDRYDVFVIAKRSIGTIVERTHVWKE